MGNPAKASGENALSYLEELLNRYETVLHQHRLDNPDLYHTWLRVFYFLNDVAIFTKI